MDTLDTWFTSCRAQSGRSNNYLGTDGVRRFIEKSSCEHNDGSITGTVYKDAGNDYVRCGSFRIDRFGNVERYPAAWPFPKRELFIPRSEAEEIMFRQSAYLARTARNAEKHRLWEERRTVALSLPKDSTPDVRSPFTTR